MKTLSVSESQKIAEKYGLKFAKSHTITTHEELEKALSHFEFPIAMKIISQIITHKSDAGGVKINIKSAKTAKTVFSEMKKLKGFEGILIQEMIRGTEIIIGGKRDVQFGPTVLVGLGGIYVEVFKDFQIGICPIKKRDAHNMIKELKAYPILKGIRGKKGINIKALEETIIKVSRMMQKEKNIEELDLNPVIATEKEIIAVDARIITQ